MRQNYENAQLRQRIKELEAKVVELEEKLRPEPDWYDSGCADYDDWYDSGC